MLTKRTLVVMTLAMSHALPVASHSAPNDALQGNQLIRTVPYERGQPIRNKVKKGDLEVTVERLWTSPDLNIPNGVDLIEWKTTLYPVVLVARVVKITGSESSTQDWVTSLVEASVLDVLKNSTASSLSERSRVVFGASGGEVSLNGARVIARFSGVERFQPDETYLIFGVVQTDDSLYVSYDNAYLLKSERFSGLDKTNKNDAIDRLGAKALVLQKIARGASKTSPPQ